MTFRSFYRRLIPESKIARGLILLWLALMLSTPAFQRLGGEAGLRLAIHLGVFFQAGTVILIFWQGTGWKRTLFTILPLLALTWLAEFIGSSTGFPFGEYHYTDILQPQVLHVPLLIPFAWLMMLPPSWAVARMIVSRRDVHREDAKGAKKILLEKPSRTSFLRSSIFQSFGAKWAEYRFNRQDREVRGENPAVGFSATPPNTGWPFFHNPLRWRVAIISALAFTAWDLFLDPQMAAWGLWQWDQPGQYFGIPLVNYVGWMLVSFILGYLLAPEKLPILPLATIYLLIWLLQTDGQVIWWCLYGSAACGFLGMGIFV